MAVTAPDCPTGVPVPYAGAVTVPDVRPAPAPAAAATGPTWPAGDAVMRRVLRVPDRKAATRDEAQRLFGTSMLISALRCLLTYIVFPIVTPLLGTATSVAPAIGLPIALVALYFDVLGIRRFWLANHRWRWPITGIYLAVMALVTALLVGDIIALA